MLVKLETQIWRHDCLKCAISHLVHKLKKIGMTLCHASLSEEFIDTSGCIRKLSKTLCNGFISVIDTKNIP